MSISYQYRTYIATFLPFRAYNIDNQLIIDTVVERIGCLHRGCERNNLENSCKVNRNM